MSQDKRAELYRNLIGSGKVTESQIGSEKDFMDAVSDEATAREFHHNLINSGTFGTDEIGEEDDFYNSISSDFEKPAPKPAKPVQKGMTEAERQAMMGSAEIIKRNVSRGQKQAFNRMDYARGNTGLKVSPVNLGENRNVVEQQPTFNPETGKVETTYITESGNEYGTRELADTEQNAIDASKTLTRQLDNAYRERDRLNELARKRIEALKKENKDKPWYRKLAEYANADKMPDAGAPMNEWDNDEEYSNLMAALRMNNAVITALEDAKNGDTNSFWHSLGKEITNGYTFSFGGSANLKDVNSTLDAMKYADMINEKRKAGRTLTDKEQAAEAIIKNQIWDNQVQALYGDQYGAWARAGKMGAVSADLMTDFLLMGGAPLAAAKGIAAAITKQGIKAFGNIVTKGLGKYMLKATGVTVGSMMAGAEMANTVGLGRTAADAGKGLGEFIIDDRGDYVFGHTEMIDGKPQFVKGMNSVISSVLDAERSAIGEYGSEVSGDFLKIGGLVLKGLNKIGLSKIANGLTAIRNADWYKAYSNALTTMGFNGVPGEALEEYVGTGFNALMGGDEWKNLADPRTHIDIWLGCATMGALLNAPRMVTTGVQMAQYYRYKHATDKADAMASTAFGDGWKEVRDALDASTNESITDALMNVLSDETLNDKQRAAALGYAINLQKMRGYSLGQVAAGEEEENENPVASDMDTNYAEGYGATIDTDMQDIRNLYNERMQRAIDAFGEIRGLDEYPVQTIQTMEQGGYTPEQIQIAKDYVNAKAAYEGMQQKVEDDIDTQVTQAQNYVDSHTNKEDNQVHPVTLKDGREAYITGRNVVMNPDGTVNVKATKEAYGDGMIFVSDMDGMISSIDVDDIAEAGAPVDADEQKEEVAAAIRQQVEDEAQRKQQGILPFNEGDTYNVLDGEGQQHEVTILPAVDGEGNPIPLQQGQVLASVDGGEAQPMAADDIQAMADNTQQVRVAEAVAEEQAQQQAEQQQAQEKAAADPYKFHNLLTINTENGPVRAHVTTEENEDGFIEVYSFVPINGKKLNLFTREELDNMVTEVMPVTEEQQEEEPQDMTSEEEPLSTVEEQPSTAEAEEYLNEQFENAPEQTEELEPMPMNGEDADFSQVTPTRAHAYIYNEAGLSREDADQFVAANKKVADDALKKVKKDKKPVMGTSISKFKKEMQAWQEKVDAAQQAADYWQEVQDIHKQADMQESMNTPSGRMELLEKASTKERKIALAKEMYSDLFDDDFTVANDIMELVALNIPKNISWEDINGKRGLQNELGLRRGVGKGFDSNAFNSYLAKKSEGISFAEAVHSIYESEDNQLQNGEHRWDDQEIRNALIDMFLSADKPTSIRDYVFNSRVARAEDALRAEQAREEEYREMEQLQQMANRMYNMTYEEAIDWIANIEELANIRDEYENSQEYLDNLENNSNFAQNNTESNDTGTEGQTGSLQTEGAGEGEVSRPSSEESIGTLPGQASEQTGVPQNTAGGNDEAAAGVAGQQVTNNIGATSSADVIAEEEAKVNTNPSEGQKKAGNYAMGHIKVDGFDVTIENPKGSVRSGVDGDGKAWSQTMNNTYGYIRGTEGVDGDHIDVFLSDTPEQGNVFVIDQINKDGSFDEHKVMYGFPDMESAKQAYLSNYEEGWQGLGAITEVSKEEFKKWVESSHRKTKPFAEYKSVKPVGDVQLGESATNNHREYVKAFLPQVGEEFASLADNLSDAEVEELYNLIEAWEPVNDEYGRVMEEQKEALKSKNKDTREAAEALVNEAQERADAAFEPVADFIKEHAEETNTNTAADNKFVGDFVANDMGVCINPNIIGEHKDKKYTYIGYDIKTAETEKGWVGGVDVETPTSGFGSPVTASEHGKYFETEQECQAYWAQKAFEHLEKAAQENKKMSKYLPSLKNIIDKANDNGADNYLQPRDAEEEKIVANVNKQLQKEIDAAIKQRDKAAADLRKARAKESDRATDLFGNDDTFNQPGQLFDNSEMPVDQSAEGVDRRTKAEQEAFNEAVANLTKLQSPQERNSRIRGALDNHRKQTSMEYAEGDKYEVGQQFDIIDDNNNAVLCRIRSIDEDGNIELSIGGHGNNYRKTVTPETLDEYRERYEISEKKDYIRTFIANHVDDEDDTFVEKLSNKETNKLHQMVIDYLDNFESQDDDYWNPLLDYIKQMREKYPVVKTEKEETTKEAEKSASYSVTPKEYVTKKGKKLDMLLVTFNDELSKEQQRAAATLARSLKGWWSKEDGGFMMRDKESVKALVESLSNEETVADAQPLSVSDMAAATEQTPTVRVIDVADVMQALKEKGETKLSDHGTLISGGVPKTETETKKTGYGANNTLVSKDRYEELKERMRKKLGGQMNMGIDPEILAIGTEMAAFHIEAGARKFADFARNMIADLGDAIRPYLKSFYNGARELPEVEEAGYSNDMTPYDEVRTFDVANFDKATTDAMAAAEEVIKEQEVSKQAEEAVQKITEQRNDGRRAQSEGVALDGTPLRPATEEDLDNRADAEYYHNGKRVYVMAVMRSGEQTESMQFSKPRIDSIYLTNGQSVKLDELMTKDDKKEPISPKDVEKVVEKSKKTSKSKNKSVSLQQEPDLFGSFFNDVEQNDNEDESESGRENRQSSTGISSGAPENARPVDNGRLDGNIQAGRNVSQGDSSVQGEGKQVRGSSERPNRRIQKLERPTNPKNTNNNHAERGKDYAPKDVDARIEANIKAIELMQQLIESGEKATPKQMAVLRQFSGWGGLGKAFENNSAYTNGKPTPEYLRELLGEEAYEQANMSRNSAYYTPANVIDTLWDIARAMGFTGGKVLEGSAGIGNIIGLMPTDLNERSNIQAVEIDQTTGNILRLLYPDAQVDIQGFEATEVENGTVDLAITNVPFVTGLRVMDTTGDKDLSKKFHDIHDFCIAKNIRKLREGGIGIFITSSGTLDNSAKLREWIVQDGNTDVVGAFRLNNETFGGTGVTSDIIVVRKRVNGNKSPYAIDVLEVSGERTAEYDTGEEKKVKGTYVPVIKTLSMDYNKYFVEHPEMMAGKMYFGFEKGNTFRPTSKALYPVKGMNQKTMLTEWANSFADKAWENPATEPQSTQTDNVYEELGEGVKEGSIVVRNGKLFIAQRGMAVPLDVNANKVKGHTKAECFEAYKAIKDALADLLAYQTENEGDEGLQKYLTALNKAYDSFVKTYGHLHKNTSISFLKNDVDFANILALEKFSEKPDVSGKKVQEYGKTDIFSRRVVDKEKAPEPDNVKDGIIASLYVHGRIDIPWITEQLNSHSGKTAMRTEDDVRNEILKSGLGFENPDTRQIEVSYEYLSGNVREKLQQARDNNSDGRYDNNIKALEEVVPMNIPPHLIEFNLGSSWIDPKLYEEYIKERTDVDVTCTPAGGTWFVKTPYWVDEEKNKTMGVRSEMFKKVVLGTQLIEAAMQNKTITVSETHKKWDGSTETITDKEATQACANKIDEIRADFKDWAKAKMQTDPELSERIERTYNDMFNNYVPKSIPDEFVPEHFGGAATVVDGKPFALRPHQGKAVVRGTTQPLLLAHEVGTGKTYTLISTAMEMRRLGTARKPMIVVQNATVGQFVESAKKLYPNAKVLTIEDKDHTGEGRKNFYAKIKYNDWDMIVVPQSVFERIPDSEERQMAYVKDKIEEKLLVLEQMKDADPQGNSMIVRQAEKEISNLEEELASLSDIKSSKRKQRDEKKAAVTRQNAEIKALEMLDRQTDDVENFDDMGIDAILVDEAHEYKHLGFATAMQRGVKGIDPSYSKKAQGVFLKTQAVLEKNNGRNVIFATGTPISNTAAEIWTFMRYLMPADTMKEYGIYYFDDFVRNFGNIQQMLEFTTSGKFKENNRFAGYVNLPELVRIWAGVADTVLTREAGGVSDKIPEMEGGKAQDLYLPQTKALRSVMKFVKKTLNEYDNMTGKQKKENSHIPLTMYGIAKAAAVDARLVVANAADEEQSKTNEAVRQILKSLEETKDYKGTVAVFADNYQNKKSGFNLYEDIREKLIAAGLPAEQIVVMKSGMTVKKKLEIFDAVNRGDIRVIMGSTFTLGTGVNIQERLHTLIHLDAPNRPMDYTQRNGRILRQGNLHKEMGKPVRVLRFGVEDSLDVTAYQRLKTKGAIADSIMNGKKMIENSMENRALEEEEDVFGDTVAQLSGSEYAMLKNQAEKDVRKYEAKRKQYEADQKYCHSEIPRLKKEIEALKDRLEMNRKNLDKVKGISSPVIVINKQQYANVEATADFLKDYNKKIREAENDLRDNPSIQKQERKLTVNVGGIDFEFTTELTIDMIENQGQLFTAIRRKMTYSCPTLNLSNVPVKQALLREGLEDIIKNVITGNDFRDNIEAIERKLAKDEKTLEQITDREGKPFEFEEELKKAHERLEEYSELMKKELEEKEKKYAYIDAGVEEASDITDAEEDDEDSSDDEDIRGRGMEDEEETFTNSSYAEALAESRRAGYTKKQFDTYIRNVQRRMRNVAEDTVAKLGLGDRVIIKDNAAGLTGDRAKLKGWYNVKTGKIVIVLGNHASAEDVKQTVLHEAVAHYGLRQLFGKNFTQFLSNVFNSAAPDVQRRINALALKHNWNWDVATEEYLASLAENTDFERASDQGWWMKIKRLFLDMLSKVGLDFRGELSDNEFRYILWRSYENLTEPDSNNPFNVAADVAMQHRLQVGRYNQSEEPIGMVAEDIRTRESDRDRAIARSAYERMVSTGMYQFQEAVQDSMLGLEKLYKAILGEDYSRIEDIPDYENAYLAENIMSSKNMAQQHMYQVRFMKPLLAEISALTGGSNAERIRLTRYMMAKHGLERNEVFAQRDFEAYKEKYPDGNLTIHDFRERDYSGLTSLTGEADVVLAEQEAQRMVDEYEQEQDTTDLWNYVNNATKASLDKVYKSGLMSIDTYEHIRDMFEYYIPLQGWDETTSDEVYGYLNDRGAGVGSSPIKHAVGRKSLADDPIATIGLMADAAIRQGNRNLMKQNFYRFVLNHPSDLVSVKDLWLHYDAVADEWNPIFPDLNANDTAEEVERKIDEFEERMQQLAEDEPDNYKRGKDAENVPYKVVKGNIKEHQVLVRRGGRTYVLTINGNPRAAQALNGLTNPDVESSGVTGNILKAASWINHHLSAFYTTRNPDFVVSNFFRDMLYSNCMTWVKENPRYALRFHKNFGKFNPATMRRLFGKWQDGTLDMNDSTEYMFYQFMSNGGETGYTNVRDIEAHKKEIQKELKSQNSNTRKVMNILGIQMDLLNRAIENCARFAAFVTSREMGRPIDRSIYDAKEVSVNFNKKGSGGKMVNATGQTTLGKVGSYLSGLGRTMFVFWNAGVQGLTNFGRAGKRYPVAAITGAAAMFVLGNVIPMIAEALGGDDDDDKNAYYNLPEYVRRTNICIRFGKQWLTIPLPIEFRALYGLGELATGAILGKEGYSNSEMAYQFASQISQILPLDMLEGGGGYNVIIPSAVKPIVEAYGWNKSWTGLPIYKDTPFNKNEPEWTKAYSNTDKTLVSISKWLNENTGGDDFKKGKIDINPAKLEYMLSGTFGGYVSTAEKLKKMAETAIGERDFDWRNMLLANRVVKNGDERTANRKLQNEYFKYLQEYNETSRLLRKYDKADEEGIAGMAEKIDFLYNSPEYLRYELFDEYKQDIDDCREELSEEVSPEERKKIQDEMYAIMRELVNQLREVK